MREPEHEVDELARAVIGAAIEVHRVLGPGFREALYEEALALEMGLRGISFTRQALVEVSYKGAMVGSGRLDFLVADRLIVELKSVDALHALHRAQVVAYLQATNLSLGLLLNFNCALMKDGVHRVIRSR
jgi:GxxExxY protein